MDDALFDPTQRKKKKSKKAATEAPADDAADYPYLFLVRRLHAQVAVDSKPQPVRRTLQPPQLLREGTKKTVWVNFQATCAALHRDADHVQAFCTVELGTTSALDGSGRLVIKSRLQPQQVQVVLQHYVGEYIACGTCRSLDTTLRRDDRLTHLECASCTASRTVPPIKQGYLAQVGRRRK